MNKHILDRSSEFFFEEALETFFFELVCEAEDESYHNENHIALKFEDGFAVVEKKLIEKFYDTGCKKSGESIKNSLKIRISNEDLL